MQTTRRSLLRTSLLAPAIATLAPRAGMAADPMLVGFVYVGPIGDAGWTYQHELGRRAMDAALGDKIKSSYVENVAEGADAERVIRKMATDGNKLIFTTSFGYMNPTLKVAQHFPRTYFDQATGYKHAVNMGTYSARFYEGRYLSGMLAGHMSKSGVVGYVAAFPIPEVVQGINAFILGAQSINPKTTVKVVWTGSWFDPGKERAAADTLISQGADFITHHTDSTAVVQAGEEKGVFTVGYSSNMAKYGPKTCLTAVTMVWDGYYIDTAKAAVDGTWKSSDVWGGLKDGMIAMAPYNSVIPTAVLQDVAAKQSQIATGTLKPFAGPIKDQDGKTKVAAGTSLIDQEILEMHWLAEGVQGKL